jgi:hypothetical protein
MSPGVHRGTAEEVALGVLERTSRRFSGVLMPLTRYPVLATTAIAVLLVLCTACAANKSAATRSFVSKAEGVTIRYPEDWRLTTHNDGYVPDPALCFDLKPKNALRVDLRIVEYLPPYFNPRYLDTYRLRPAHFRLTTFRTGDEDWSPPNAKVLQFREKRRVFMVGLVRPNTTNRTLAQTIRHILDSFAPTKGGQCRPTSGVGSHGVPKP